MIMCLLKFTIDTMPRYMADIEGLSERDLSNIIVALRSLADQLADDSEQRIECEELAHALKGQKAQRLKVLATMKRKSKTTIPS